LNRRALAWAGYDVASSVYVGVAPSVLMPLYVRELAKGSENPTAVWGILSAVAVLVSSLAALAAASATLRFSRFALLTGLTMALVAAMVGLAWNPHASLAQAALAFVAAQSFYFAAMTIYESFLPDIAQPQDCQKLSGLGWATGYLGGIAAIAALLVLVAGRPQSIELLALCFGTLVALATMFYAIVLLTMRREGFAALRPADGIPKMSKVRVIFRHWRERPGVVRLLLGMMLIQMGIFVVITFTTPILSDRFGQSLADMLWLLLVIHVLAVPSTLAWSHLLTGVSRLPAMAFLLASWVAVLLLLAFGSGVWMPLITVTVIGCCLGATFAGLRGFLAEVVGESDPVAMFAFATMAGRIAAAAGPILFSLMLFVAGERAALLMTLAVLALGGIIVMTYLRREGGLPIRTQHLS
jgi:UMF1 family MFS transporter